MARYEYAEYRRKQFATLEELEGLKDLAFTKGAIATRIVAGVQMIAVFGILIARSRVITDHMQQEKQEYERDRSERNREERRDDPLDSERRPE